MSRTGPGGGGPGRGGAAAPALGPGRPRGEPELCCPSGRSLGGGGRTATDPSLAFTGPSPARGRGAHPAGRAARRRFGQRWGEVEWTPGSDTFANRARTPRPEGLPGPGRGRRGGAGRPNTAPCSLRLGCRSSAPPHGRPSFLSLFLSSVVSDMSRPGDMPFFCPVGVWGEDGPADASGCGQPSPGRLVVLHSSWPRGPAASRAAGAHGHTSPGAAGPPQLASMCLLRERGHLGSPEAELSVQGMVGAPWGPASGDQGVLSRSGQRPLWS